MALKTNTNIEGKNHLEDLGVDRQIILKLFLTRDIDKCLGVLYTVSIRCGGFIA
jgi:hypothetical protein